MKPLSFKYHLASSFLWTYPLVSSLGIDLLKVEFRLFLFPTFDNS